VPRSGSLILPKDVSMEPFSLKGLLNASLSAMFSLMASGSNGLPGGHSDLGGGLPGLQEHSLEGVLVVEVPTAPFRPKIEKEEAPKNVKGLSPIGEASWMVTVEPRRVVLLLDDSLAKKHKRPGDPICGERVIIGVAVLLLVGVGSETSLPLSSDSTQLCLRSSLFVGIGMAAMKKVFLIAGASSKNGTSVAKLLLAETGNKYIVRVGARDPTKLSALVALGAEAVVLDTSLESAFAAFSGVHGVFIS